MADTVLIFIYARSDPFPVLINPWHHQKSMAGDDCCAGGWLKPERAMQAVT